MSEYHVVTYIVSSEDELRAMEIAAKTVTEYMNKGYAVTTQYQATNGGRANWETKHQVYIEGRKRIEAPPKPTETLMTYAEYKNITKAIDAFKGTAQMDYNAHQVMMQFINMMYERGREVKGQ
ncbi:hypothetical protein [Bacillus phage BC-T25]|nr:hypothetical protein [Bacillus phage BC-T25]